MCRIFSAIKCISKSMPSKKCVEALTGLKLDKKQYTTMEGSMTRTIKEAFKRARAEAIKRLGHGGASVVITPADMQAAIYYLKK
jgi:hypothetical protein